MIIRGVVLLPQGKFQQGDNMSTEVFKSKYQGFAVSALRVTGIVSGPLWRGLVVLMMVGSGFFAGNVLLFFWVVEAGQITGPSSKTFFDVLGSLVMPQWYFQVMFISTILSCMAFAVVYLYAVSGLIRGLEGAGKFLWSRRSGHLDR